MKATEQTFLGLPTVPEGGVAPKAVIAGVRHATAYPEQDCAGHAAAAAAIRAASQEDAGFIGHFDFDLGGPLFGDGPVCCIDGGDIDTTAHDNAANRLRIEETVQSILSSSAVPILMGGDCSVTIPFLSGFSGGEPIVVVQIDAHIDWREERFGERFGFSSPMRRASEMPHVAGMVQVGMRGVGSARPADVDDALAYGSRFVPARAVRTSGIDAVVAQVPKDARIVITLDCDSLDPSVMPGVVAQAPGGLTYAEIIDLIAALGRHARIAGFNLVEFYPPADVGNQSAIVASRILVNVIGAVVRQGS
ncbi:arginase family protein [Rhizobium sp. SG2393]|uniref:arginase family protein n=1 Tax=Rhizobium sp. SG2393 TaxID=3276279 RepID=UPI00366B691D